MPALHALIVGVSTYPHLPGGDGDPAPDTYEMRQLSACAASAVSVKEWLQEAGGRLTVPLGSLRLLLSPSPDELAGRPELAAGAEFATRENLRRAALAWREECESDPDNIALFYFAGHGVQRTRSDSVLLMRDFGDAAGNPLFNAVDVNNLFGGMAPSAVRPRMARTQLWFIDACRGFPTEFDRFETLSASEVFEVELSDGDRRCAPIYFGALPGENAYSVAGERTLFNRALLESLHHSGGQKLEGEGRWIVTAGSLLRGMQATIDKLNVEEGCEQEIWDGGQMADPNRRVAELAAVPDVDVRLELVPAAAVDRVTVAVSGPDGVSKPVPNPLRPNPFVDRWQAGAYRLETTPPIDGADREPIPVRPPAFEWRARVAP